MFLPFLHFFFRARGRADTPKSAKIGRNRPPQGHSAFQHAGATHSDGYRLVLACFFFLHFLGDFRTTFVRVFVFFSRFFFYDTLGFTIVGVGGLNRLTRFSANGKIILFTIFTPFPTYFRSKITKIK